MKKNFLIIGGSTGIGKAICDSMSLSHNIFSTYHKNEMSSNEIHYQHCNVLEPIDLKDLPDVIHGVCYCPGSIDLKPVSRISGEQMIEDYKLQVIGAFNVIKSVLPKLKAADQASIVLFSTVAVEMGFPFHSLVAASKGAIQGLTKSLAAELAPKIRVNCIAPSITETPLAAGLLNTEEKIANNALRHPLKAIGKAEDVASMASFLLDSQSKWMTGQIIHIDGGMSSLKV
jgi:NAD(P)-dependent dehydrogenase (short-subunit alcohol dehydrogenase family)